MKSIIGDLHIDVTQIVGLIGLAIIGVGGVAHGGAEGMTVAGAVAGGIAGWLAKGNKVTTTTEGDPPTKTTTEP